MQINVLMYISTYRIYAHQPGGKIRKEENIRWSVPGTDVAWEVNEKKKELTHDLYT